MAGARCNVCGGAALIDRPMLLAFQARCTVCGWLSTHRGISLANIVRMTDQYAFYPGGAHLSKRLFIGNGSIACGIPELDAEQWPRQEVLDGAA